MIDVDTLAGVADRLRRMAEAAERAADSDLAAEHRGEPRGSAPELDAAELHGKAAGLREAAYHLEVVRTRLARPAEASSEVRQLAEHVPQIVDALFPALMQLVGGQGVPMLAAVRALQSVLTRALYDEEPSDDAAEMDAQATLAAELAVTNARNREPSRIVAADGAPLGRVDR